MLLPEPHDHACQRIRRLSSKQSAAGTDGLRGILQYNYAGSYRVIIPSVISVKEVGVAHRYENAQIAGRAFKGCARVVQKFDRAVWFVLRLW